MAAFTVDETSTADEAVVMVASTADEAVAKGASTVRGG